MNCPHCGNWSDVLATRTPPPGDVIKRTRICANGHRFGTLETSEPEASLLRRRNRQIVEAVLGGATMTATARQFGLRSHSEVSRLVARAAPEFNARSSGQTAAWSTTRAHQRTTQAEGTP